MDLADFENWLAVKAGQGFTQDHLLRIAIVSINQHLDAADRWARLEGGNTRSAPFWIEEREARKLLGVLKGQRGTEIRLLRQTLEELFAE